jgi:hypothetical protein
MSVLGKALMSNNVEPNDDFELNAQRQGDAKPKQAVAEASTAHMIERERTQRLESQIQIGSSASCSLCITRQFRTIFDVLLRARVMFSSILWTVKSGIEGLLTLFLARLIGFALARPTLKAWALAFLRRCPAFEAWLYKFAAARGIIFSSPIVRISSDVSYEPSTKFSRLTPRARSIYADLKAAIERQNKGGNNTYSNRSPRSANTVFEK